MPIKMPLINDMSIRSRRNLFMALLLEVDGREEQPGSGARPGLAARGRGRRWGGDEMDELRRRGMAKVFECWHSLGWPPPR